MVKIERQNFRSMKYASNLLRFVYSLGWDIKETYKPYTLVGPTFTRQVQESSCQLLEKKLYILLLNSVLKGCGGWGAYQSFNVMSDNTLKMLVIVTCSRSCLRRSLSILTSRDVFNVEKPEVDLELVRPPSYRESPDRLSRLQVDFVANPTSVTRSGLAHLSGFRARSPLAT